MARLLICNTCKTVDKLPDYATENDPEAKYDYTLKDAIDRHMNKFGGPVERHKALMYGISDDELALIDSSALEQAVHDNRLESFLREEREMLKEDAIKCYDKHNRPTYNIGYSLGCIDYRSKDKAIGRTTGLAPEEWSYVCDFCPYHSYVEHAKHKKNKSLFL